ncbi:hypothetical protein DM02DRAFT_619516 [Periconia macrospinosa]|uniref:Uncharacterized protein n=1 Tax=Periconia macrospinosa TaxID=97972 RepID=A0A2V1D4Y2_9PLEO|nr:hypothetical protein DM02DRAFT_619515 [Periconia macrospinosa]PVH93092.1 hypothetical protein DM02DRAFT_619516 [Periconia macrospinosa]
MKSPCYDGVTRLTRSKFVTGLATYLIDRVNLALKTWVTDEDVESSREVFVYRVYRKTFTVMDGSECADRGRMRGCWSIESHPPSIC